MQGHLGPLRLAPRSSLRPASWGQGCTLALVPEAAWPHIHHILKSEGVHTMENCLMLLFIWFHVDYSSSVCLWKKSPRDRLGANKCYYSRKGSRKRVHLLFWNMEISLMTWLTWQVDSGDRWLTSSWRPPMERERKKAWVSVNTLPAPPDHGGSFPGQNELSNDIMPSPEGRLL